LTLTLATAGQGLLLVKWWWSGASDGSCSPLQVAADYWFQHMRFALFSICLLHLLLAAAGRALLLVKRWWLGASTVVAALCELLQLTGFRIRELLGVQVGTGDRWDGSAAGGQVRQQ
jgi:hypothetical protein